MLTIHVLNVEQGSSAVVEFDNGAEKFFGVVDSNLPAGAAEPRALTKLRELGARRLSFVCLTHPHKDHFKGLLPIIQAFDGAIDYFYSCPFGALFQNQKRLKQFAGKLKAICKTSDGEPRKEALELLQIIMWATKASSSGSLDWRECAGEHFQLAPPGFAGVSIVTVLPPTKVKGPYIQQIERQDGLILGTFKENEISLALEFSYHGAVLVLGGDGTIANWTDRRRWEQHGKSSINASIVNLPHHGSRHDCPDEVLLQLFAPAGERERAGITSANGQSHPSIDVIKWMETNGVKPYCTNLIPQCGANAQRLLNVPTLDPPMQRWIREVASNSGTVQPCQGDVSIIVDDQGNSRVVRQFKNLCAFRGEFARLGV